MRREDLFVREMIDAAQTVLDLIADSAPEVIEVDMIRRGAVLWNYTVLGEAANQLASDFKAAHAGIQWVEAGRLRNRLVHGYWDVDFQILHGTATRRLPELIAQLTELLATLESARPTDQQIQAWADEAEAGYDGDELRRRGPQSAQSPQEMEEQP
jgi:uncharacterized protein with HEPN domain